MSNKLTKFWGKLSGFAKFVLIFVLIILIGTIFLSAVTTTISLWLLNTLGLGFIVDFFIKAATTATIIGVIVILAIYYLFRRKR